MGRGRPHDLNGSAHLLDTTPAMSPVDFPLPELRLQVFGFRVSVNDDRTHFTLRVTPVTPVGPGQWAPCADHHTDIIYGEENMLTLMEHFVNCMTEDQRARVRALLSDITIPPAIA